MKNITILGSTGSIGQSTVDIIRDNPDKFNIIGLSCNNNIDLLRKQILEFNPKFVSISNEKKATEIKEEFKNIQVLSGESGNIELVKMQADMVVNALMGISGLLPTYEAIMNGKDIALANKETMVTGGELIMKAVKKMGVRLLPIDSEHSAIFQCLESRLGSDINRITLTASGGPFRGYSKEELEKVTIKDALNHPKWKMGKKITIDSATMMNKGLEIIEARWLFDVQGDKIDVHIHPESIVHSAVEFEDNSIIAQMSFPDMKIPISLALNYPNRNNIKTEKLDLFNIRSLNFEKTDREVFRCLDIAYEALNEGKSAPIIMNGANEELVEMFLQGAIKFTDIQRYLLKVMERQKFYAPSSIEDIIQIDKEARAYVREIVRNNIC